jgi:hypothetical protein
MAAWRGGGISDGSDGLNGQVVFDLMNGLMSAKRKF